MSLLASGFIGMIMIQDLSQRHSHSYGGSYTQSFGLMSRLEGYEFCNNKACVGSDPVIGLMDEEESRTETSTTVNEAGSSSKDVQDQDETKRDNGGWLQLGIGGGHTTSHDKMVDDNDSTARRAGLIELDLLPGPGGGSNQVQDRSLPIPTAFHMPEFGAPRPVFSTTSATYNYSSSLFLQHSGGPGSSSTFPLQHQEINWAFRPIPRNSTVASTSSSSSLMPPGSNFARPFQVQLPSAAGADVGGPSLDFRIVDPRRRPRSGIWFMLRASQNQGREPFLPQIPKSYLRIKDGRMTVGLLMKYLVIKLTLDSESEIEISCKGQRLQPFLTLQHVRDGIWSPTPRDAVTLLPHASTADHVMVLHYARPSTTTMTTTS